MFDLMGDSVARAKWGRRRSERTSGMFSGPEPEVREAAADLVAAWDTYRAVPGHVPPIASVAAQVEALREALTDDSRALSVAVSDYLGGAGFWCDEDLKLAELRLRRTAYPLPAGPQPGRCRISGYVPPVLGRHSLPPGVTPMPFRAWPPSMRDR
jgi:hypothetical protein